MCHGGCGALLHVTDNKITKIEGDPDNPMNKGKLCPLGAASLEQIDPATAAVAEVNRVAAWGPDELPRCL